MKKILSLLIIYFLLTQNSAIAQIIEFGKCYKVDKYNKDPLCGFQCSVGFYLDFLPCLIALKDSTKAMKNYPKDLPCYIMCGEKDPCGEFGYAAEQIIAEFKRVGAQSPKVSIYSGARHEIFNEINRDEVTNDFITWCNLQVSKL